MKDFMLCALNIESIFRIIFLNHLTIGFIGYFYLNFQIFFGFYHKLNPSIIENYKSN
jgi:hypothetical protein